MNFFINYFRAYRYTGGKDVNDTFRGLFAEIIEILLVICFFFIMCSVDFDLYSGKFYQLDIAVYAAAFTACRMPVIVANGGKYRLVDMFPSDYKRRAVGEYVNAAIMFVFMVAYMSLIFSLTQIIYLFIDTEQTYINLSQNGVEMAFKISLCIWLAANGMISGKIQKFGKRIVYDVIMIVVTVGACMVINNASNGFTKLIVAGDAAARFSMLHGAALWLILAYAVSLAALAVSFVITLNREKPKQF